MTNTRLRSKLRPDHEAESNLLSFSHHPMIVLESRADVIERPYVPADLRRVGGTTLPDERQRNATDLSVSDADPLAEEAVILHPGDPACQRTGVSDKHFVGMWEGLVESIDEVEGYFTARIVGDHDGKEQTAEFFLDDVAADDQELLVPGAAFYWTIFRQFDAAGRPHRVTDLRVRRLRQPSLTELERAQAAAERFLALQVPDGDATQGTGTG